MPESLDRILDRVQQNRTARQRNLDNHLARAPCAETRLGCTFVAGARVFDRVTGEVGEVLGGTRENVIVPATK